MAISMFPGEIVRISRRWAQSRYANLVHLNELDRGGRSPLWSSRRSSPTNSGLPFSRLRAFFQPAESRGLPKAARVGFKVAAGEEPAGMTTAVSVDDQILL